MEDIYLVSVKWKPGTNLFVVEVCRYYQHEVTYIPQHFLKIQSLLYQFKEKKSVFKMLKQATSLNHIEYIMSYFVLFYLAVPFYTNKKYETPFLKKNIGTKFFKLSNRVFFTNRCRELSVNKVCESMSCLNFTKT